MRNGLFPVPVLLFLVLFPFSASGDGGFFIEDVSVIPPVYTIGEVVTLRIIASSPEFDEQAAPFISREDKWFEIKAIETNRRNNKVFIYIQVVSFYPGKRVFPVINFNGHEIRDIELSPQKILDKNDYEFAPVRESLLLPGTKLFILLTFFCCVAIIAIFLFLGKRLLSAARKVPGCFYMFGKRILRRSTMSKLLKLYVSIPPAEVYKRLTREAKNVLERERNLPCLQLTTSELSAMLTSYGRLKAQAETNLVPVLRRGDTVRFGGEPVDRDEILTDIRRIDTFSRFLEREKIRQRKIDGNVRIF